MSAQRLPFTAMQPCSPRAGQRGTTMIEILVSLVLLSLGLIGSTQLITSAIKEQSALKYKITASQLANDLMERMRSNRLAIDQGFYVDIDNANGNVLSPRIYSNALTLVRIASVPNVCNPTCTNARDAARLDVVNTRIALRNQLPPGAAIGLRRVRSATGANLPDARLIIVAWAEPILNTVATASNPASAVALADGADGCPTGFNDYTGSDLKVRCLQFMFRP